MSTKPAPWYSGTLRVPRDGEHIAIEGPSGESFRITADDLPSFRSKAKVHREGQRVALLRRRSRFSVRYYLPGPWRARIAKAEGNPQASQPGWAIQLVRSFNPPPAKGATA